MFTTYVRNHLGFRNYNSTVPQLVDRAVMLRLTAPEMSVLVAGMRVLNANKDGSKLGVFTNQPESLTNDFFVNLLDYNIAWKKAGDSDLYEGRDYGSGELKWTGSQVDLVFGSNSELRAIAEHYGCDDAKQEFAEAFVAAWTKVMSLDRFVKGGIPEAFGSTVIIL